MGRLRPFLAKFAKLYSFSFLPSSCAKALKLNVAFKNDPFVGREKKAHKHKLFALVRVRLAPGQPAS